MAASGIEVGGAITKPITAAYAGFVVYVDANDNGKLDLAGTFAASPDTIVGGNRQLVLTYLRDGSSLDYEKMRDKAGVLPASAFNLMWTERERWLPLSAVELTIDSDARLPDAVCRLSPNSPVFSDAGVAGTASRGDNGNVGSKPSADGGTGTIPTDYPNPSDPDLKCDPDGLTFTYSPRCPPPVPRPVGLCAPRYWGYPQSACVPPMRRTRSSGGPFRTGGRARCACVAVAASSCPTQARLQRRRPAVADPRKGLSDIRSLFAIGQLAGRVVESAGAPSSFRASTTRKFDG